MNDSVGSLVLFWTGVKCDRSGRSVCFSLSIGLWNSQIGDVCQTPEHWGDGRPSRASRLLLHAYIRSLLPPLSASMGTMNRRACSVPADLCLLTPSAPRLPARPRIGKRDQIHVVVDGFGRKLKRLARRRNLELALAAGPLSSSTRALLTAIFHLNSLSTSSRSYTSTDAFLERS